MPNDDWLRVWQEQPRENVSMPLEEIRRKARQFESTIRNRNRREYIAAVFVLIAFTYYIFRFPDPLARTSFGLIIAGTLYVMYQLHRRASAASMPEDMGLTSSMSFHRMELVRQREALESVLSWYLAPFAPGLLVIGIRSSSKSELGAAFFVAICGAVFGGIWWLNRRGAERISRQIAELDKLGGS